MFPNIPLLIYSDVHKILTCIPDIIVHPALILFFHVYQIIRHQWFESYINVIDVNHCDKLNKTFFYLSSSLS